MRFYFFLLRFSALIYILFNSSNTYGQEITIAAARLHAEGDTVKIRGIVTAIEFGDQKYIQDLSSGIALYSSSLSLLKSGDSIVVEGVIKNYYGELELSPVLNYTLLSSGNILPNPIILSLGDGFKESNEGRLLRFNDIAFSASGTFDAGTSGKNYVISQGSVQKEIRIKPQTNLPGKTIPTGKVDIIGILSHYKSGTTDKYQLYPRSFSDVIVLKGPVIESGPVQSDIKTDGFTVSFTTREAGNTIVSYGLTKQLELQTYSDKALKKEHVFQLSGLNPATFYYVRVASVKGSDTSFSSIVYYSTASLSKGKFIAYFNRPVNTTFASVSNAVYLNKTIDDTLVAYINRAELSIDLAIYNFDNLNLNTNITSALNNAHQRGVRVRIIGDGSTTNNGLKTISGPQVLKSPQGSNYSIMHNKFLVFDAAHSNPDKCILWTGSTNLTDNQIHTDPNNVLIIYDQAVAKAYTLEFEEMWGSSGNSPSSVNAKFGQFKTDNTPHLFVVGGNLTEVYFSPNEQVNTRIISFIKSAKHDIYFGTFMMTRTEIASQIKNKFNEGVYSAGIFGDISGSNSAPYDILKPALGDSLIKVYSKSGVFHHKYAIVDQSDAYGDAKVLTGSHNWSRSADESNDENTVIVHNREVANWYLQEWAQRFIDEGGKVFIGFEKSLSENKLKCFIFNDHLIINSNEPLFSDLFINIYDLQGKIIFTETISGNQNTNFNISLPELSQHFYLVSIRNEFFKQSFKMIRQNN